MARPKISDSERAERVREWSRQASARRRVKLATDGKTQLLCWIPATLRAQLDAIADQSGASVSDTVSLLLETAVITLWPRRDATQTPDLFDRERRDAELDARIAANRAAAQRAVEKQRTEAAAAGLLLPGVNITDPIFPDHQTPDPTDTTTDSASLVSVLDTTPEKLSTDPEPDLSTDNGDAQLSPGKLSTASKPNTGGKAALSPAIVEEVLRLHGDGLSGRKIAAQLGIGSSSVWRIIERAAV